MMQKIAGYGLLIVVLVCGVSGWVIFQKRNNDLRAEQQRLIAAGTLGAGQGN